MKLISFVRHSLVHLLWGGIWAAAVAAQAETIAERFHQHLSLRQAAAAAALLPRLEAESTPSEAVAAHAALGEAWLRDGDYQRAVNLFEGVAKAVEGGVTLAEGDGWRGSLELARLAAQVPSQTVAKREPGVVVFQRDQAGLNRLQAKIEGQEQEMVWDTGANVTTMTESTAARLGLTPLAGTVTVGTPTGASVQARMAVAKRIEVANCVLEHVLVLLLPDANLTFPEANYAIDAILGFPAIDALGTVRIEAGGRTTVGLPELTDGPQNLRLEGLSPHVLIQMQGREFELMLDSGANESELHPEAFKQLPSPPPLREHGQRQFRGAAGAGKRYDNQVADLELTLGGKVLAVEAMVIADAQSSAHETLGVVGNDLLLLGGTYEINFRTLRLRFQTAIAP